MQNDIVWQVRNYQRDKANGVKHTPLHTLQECCEAAGITPSWFGRYAAKDPNAPQLVLNIAKTAWRAGKKYYRKHEFVQWVNQVRQQKEKAMPDIKTALEKALAKTAIAWAADDEAHQQIQPEKLVPTTPDISAPEVKANKREGVNLSRATFEYVRDNPGLTNVEVTKALVAQGHNANSVSSLCYQMLRVRLVVADANGGLSAVVQEYVPIQTSLMRKRRAQTKAKSVRNKAPAPVVEAPTPRKHIELVNTRTGEVFNPKPAPALVEKEWHPSDVIDTLSVRQALALFKELRNILVG